MKCCLYILALYTPDFWWSVLFDLRIIDGFAPVYLVSSFHLKIMKTLFPLLREMPHCGTILSSQHPLKLSPLSDYGAYHSIYSFQLITT